LKDALAVLIPVVRTLADRPAQPAVRPTRPTVSAAPAADRTVDAALSQGALWDAVAGFLRPGDIVLADQGTCFYGMGTHRLPHGVTFVGQPLWASIGYTLPALLGVCLAEPGRRGILLIGDGAAQMTVQELGTVIRHGLTPTVIVVDNDGYTVERAIHGPGEPYNDISRWDWTAVPQFFGGLVSSDARRVGTVGELRTALTAAEASPDRLTLLQVVVPAMDVPPLLDALARSLGAAPK